MTMAIKDWHEDDRPREKLLKHGPEHLTDAEILAIFLRTGTKDQSALELARSLIAHFGSIAELLAAPKVRDDLSRYRSCKIRSIAGQPRDGQALFEQ